MKKEKISKVCSLTGEEVMRIDGGSNVAKDITYTVVGSVLTANCVVVGALVTPAAGVVALGTGLVYLGKGIKGS